MFPGNAFAKGKLCGNLGVFCYYWI